MAALFWQKISRNGQGIFHKSANDRERWGLLIFAAKATFDAWLCQLAHSPQEAAVPRKLLVKMNLTIDCSMIKATIRTVNFAACGNYHKNNKIWQDRSPIRKSSIILRSRKTLFILLHQLLFNPASQNVLYGRCGWRLLRWRRLAHSLLTQFLVSALSIIAGIAPLHRLEFELFSWNFL